VVARAATQGCPYKGTPMNDLFFDLETQKSIQEVGGRENIRLLRVSVAVTFSTATNAFKSYDEKQVPALVADLKAADRIIGFNLLQFDYQVLKYYSPERFSDLPTLDLLADIYNKLGFRIGLDALAAATLGARKSADGLMAIRWFREGKLDELTAYCRDDVAVTKQLFEAGRDKGFVQYVDRDGQTKRVNVNWK
jgi:DEAD/DEAH box helicase domain-containing protein